ncbi:MAG: efflux RND transporter periplasmic adaptor subunit [Breznakibacter sp.]
MKKAIIIIATLAVALLIFIRLKNNHDKINAKKEVSTDLNYVNVTATKVKSITMDQSISLVGNLTAFTEVEVSSEIQGTITSVKVELGQQVSDHTVIATIDDRIKKLNVNSAKIDLEKKQKDYDRYKNLFAGGTATEQEQDDARVAYENAAIKLEQAQKEFSDATIISPSQGIITEKHIEKGSYVNVGSPIVSMVDISKLKVKLNVSETNIYQLNVGDQAEITTTIYPEITFNGNVRFISPKGDDSHNYQVEIVIPNSNEHPLKAGTFVKVKINLPTNGSRLYIPREALQGSISDAKVYVAKDGKALSQAITIGKSNNDYLEVVSGLQEGDDVITTGFVNLENGKAIQVNESVN